MASPREHFIKETKMEEFFQSPKNISLKKQKREKKSDP